MKGQFKHEQTKGDTLQYILDSVPDGSSFRVYDGHIAQSNDITDKPELIESAQMVFIVESPGGIVETAITIWAINKAIQSLIKVPGTPSLSNNQASSSNNSLTDRNNVPRPYKRIYDICGTVQSIPSNLMTTYSVFDDSGKEFEYGYYYIARGDVYTPASGVTDGDTLLSEVTGSGAMIYAPYTSPNNSSSAQVIGDSFEKDLYITTHSVNVDGETLTAPNETDIALHLMRFSRPTVTEGIISDDDNQSSFDDFIEAGDIIRIYNVGLIFSLNGNYIVESVSANEIKLTISDGDWTQVALGGTRILNDFTSTLELIDKVKAVVTDWSSITKIKCDSFYLNIVAANGLYKDSGSTTKPASVTVTVEYQFINDNLDPYGDIYTTEKTIERDSNDLVGMTINVSLPFETKVRVRCYRSSDKDLDFSGNVSDEIKYRDLYGQKKDLTPHYGDITTIHTQRKNTVRATSVSNPELGVVTTEMLYKYLGGGVFAETKTTNTQGMQSLIRLLRDSAVGGLNLSNANMDHLISVQEEIEEYFNNTAAGEFSYTFDDSTTTTQDIIATIAEVLFCNSYREGNAVKMSFDRPRIGPEMVFTHRSKSPAGESWSRVFNSRSTYDSLTFSYIDPNTNIQETISIPEEGGAKTENYESKGVRSYEQAYWLAWRRHQRNLLRKQVVTFNATEEGIYAIPNRAISVVKGSRVAPYDGYVIAVNGLELTLSQPVEFTDGDDHSIILKKRDGSIESIDVTQGGGERKVLMQSFPLEPIYTGNSALKTEFSFGNEERHKAQMMVVSTVNPSNDRYVSIEAYNYEDDYYLKDGVQPFGSGFDDGFDEGFG